MQRLIGTAEGDRQARIGSNGGYEALRVATIRWAMVDAMLKPPRGFEEPINLHFALKRAYIYKTVTTWLEEVRGLPL